MTTKFALATALCALSIGAFPGSLFAQQAEPLLPVPQVPTGPQAPAAPGDPVMRGITVTDRARPEVDPLGIRVGSFFFFPRGEVDESYNDNVFATNGGTKSDFITTLAPSFDLLSNFPTNAINLHAGAAIGRYATNSGEDFEDAYGAADGRFDITANNHILAGLRIDRLHEPRTSPDSPGNGAEPVKYNTYAANLGINQTGLRIGYEADLALRRSEYQAVPAIGGGLITQSDRNVNAYEAALKGTYEFQPNYQVYLRGALNTQQYDHAAGNGVPIRDSNGYRVDVGAKIDLTGVTTLDVYVGYLEQEYRASRFGSLGGVDFGGLVTWNATTLDTVKVNLQRSVQDINSTTGIGLAGGTASFANSPGYLQSIGTVSLDHELLRNLLLNGNLGFEEDAFKGVSRTDDVYTVGAGVKYLLNRNLYLGATYAYQNRSSSGAQATNPYSQNIFMLRLSTQL